MSDQRKRNVEDEREEESDEEYTPDESGSDGSGESGSESEGKKPRTPVREVFLVYIINFPPGCEETCERRIGLL
jgi:hypothetical protein